MRKPGGALQSASWDGGGRGGVAGEVSRHEMDCSRAEITQLIWYEGCIGRPRRAENIEDCHEYP